MKKIEVKPFKVIGIGVRTSNVNNQAQQDLGALWSKWYEENIAAQIPNKISEEFFGIYTNYESDNTKPYDALIACKVSDSSIIPEGRVAKEMEGGTFAVFTTKGDMSEGKPIAEKWGEIWNTDLPRAYTNDFELYDQRAANPADAEVDILIALK